jgi:hypothetical protein
VEVEHGITFSYKIEHGSATRNVVREGGHSYKWVNPFPAIFYGLMVIDVVFITWLLCSSWRRTRTRYG